MVLSSACCCRSRTALGELAALTEPIAVGVHAVGLANLAPHDVPLVIGCGPVGLAVIAALKFRGVEPDRRRRLLARRAVRSPRSRGRRGRRPGRDVAVRELADAAVATTPSRRPPRAWWRRGAPLRPAVIFECVGVPGVIDQIVARRAGLRTSRRGRRVHGARHVPADGRARQGAQPAVRLLLLCRRSTRRRSRRIADGKIDVASMVTGRVGLDGVPGAFGELADPERHAKILIRA